MASNLLQFFFNNAFVSLKVKSGYRLSYMKVLCCVAICLYARNKKSFPSDDIYTFLGMLNFLWQPICFWNITVHNNYKM